MRSRWCGAAVVLVVGSVLALVGGGAGAQAGKDRELRVTVVHARTGEPVEGASVSGSAGRGAEGQFKLTTDAKGECRVPVGGATEVTFFYRKANFAEGIVAFGPRYGEPIPETCTVRLVPGVPIGGVVRDEQGKGVAGAKVQLTFETTSAERPGRTTMNYGHAETDAEGRWAFGGGPERPERISVYASHPDFVMKSFSHDYGAEWYAALREKRLETEIRRGVAVSGVVTDEAGQPVAGAEVTPDNSFGLVSCTATDGQGRFTLRGVEPGRRVIGVRAAGLGPQVREVPVGKEGAGGPVEFRLAKGREVRVRVVDAGGKGVANASVYVSRWGEAGSGWPSLGGIGRTGPDGLLVWNGAPAEAVAFQVSAPGAIQVRDVTARAGDGAEVRVVVRPPVFVRGTVVDDVTGKPVDAFKVEVTGQVKGNPRYTGLRRDGSGGKFEALADFEGDVFWVRVVADGYLPAESPKAESKGGPVVFDLRLKKGRPVTGTVRVADGRPAAGAEVVLIDTYAPQVRNGVVNPRSVEHSPVGKTDAAGAFALPPREGKLKALVVHESGWGEVRREVDGKAVDVTLRPWCAVAGRVMRGDRPWAGQRVTMMPILYRSEDGQGISVRAYFNYDAVTDADGRFSFDRVVNEEVEISLEGGDHQKRLKLAPGERRTDLRLGGEGRPVVAKVVVPAELKREDARPLEAHLTRVRPVFIRPGNWDSLKKEEQSKLRAAFEATPEYRRWADGVQMITATIGADGSLRAEDVPEGDYTLKVYGLGRSPGQPNYDRISIAADALVQVPAIPGGRSDEPIDAGTLELKDYNRLAVGQAAPAFVAATLEGGQFDLAKLRGKYVLLDFWATWCGPCIAEMPHLEQIHRKWAADGRLVVVSVSVDDRVDEPRRFMAERKLPWVQAFAGDLTPSPGRRVFGVGAIPSVWLIDPEGRIVAKEVYGEQIDEAVKKALGK